MKDCTILIYANGNNEMEPEIYESFLSAKRVADTKNINIVMEIGRANRSLVSLINPSKLIRDNGDIWSGVRRYTIENSKPNLLENLGFINMADPKSLYNFIEWGINNFPAKKYILLISGHGIAYMGGLTDLTLDAFYIMGIPEMCQAINSIKKNLDINIDLLFLDMCYMNLIEIMYELAKGGNAACKNAITYFNQGPLSGISLENLISSVQKYSKVEDSKEFIKNLILDTSQTLICYKLDTKILEEIKHYFNLLAQCYSSMGYKYASEVADLLGKPTEIVHCNSHIEKIASLVSSLVVYTNNTKGVDIKITCMDLGKFISIYTKLSFAQDNEWSKFLSSYTVDNTGSISLDPSKLSFPAMQSFLSRLNPHLNTNDIFIMLSKLMTYHANQRVNN